jgi:excisionase family DNA binding protein
MKLLDLHLRTSRPMLTQRQVCELLQIGASTLQKLRRAHKVRFVKLGYRSIRFRQEDVADFIRRRERGLGQP